jgi:hypothetical protein
MEAIGEFGGKRSRRIRELFSNIVRPGDERWNPSQTKRLFTRTSIRIP